MSQFQSFSVSVCESSVQQHQHQQQQQGSARATPPSSAASAQHQSSFLRSHTPPQGTSPTTLQPLLSAPAGGVVGNSGVVVVQQQQPDGDLSSVNASGNNNVDQAKYRTTLCRNWESTGGTCTFRGCSFAHGVDEIVVRTACSSSNGTSSAPRVDNTTAGGGFPSSPSSNSSFNSSHMEAVSARSDLVAEALLADIAKLRAMHGLQQDAQRTLENLLAREMAGYRETTEGVRQLRQEIAAMEEKEVEEKNAPSAARVSEGGIVAESASASPEAASQNSNTTSLQQQKQQEEVKALLQSLGALQ